MSNLLKYLTKVPNYKTKRKKKSVVKCTDCPMKKKCNKTKSNQ